MISETTVTSNCNLKARFPNQENHYPLDMWFKNPTDLDSVYLTLT